MADTGKTKWDRFVDKVYTQPTPQQQKALNSLVNALPGSMTPVGGDQQAQLEAMVRALPPERVAQALPQPQAGAPQQGQGQPQPQPQQPSFMDMLVQHLVQMLSLPRPAPGAAAQPLPQRMQAGQVFQQNAQDMGAAMQELRRQGMMR